MNSYLKAAIYTFLIIVLGGMLLYLMTHYLWFVFGVLGLYIVAMIYCLVLDVIS